MTTVPTIDIPREVAALSQALDAPLLPQWEVDLARFSAATGRYAEYQISLANGELALVTLGRGAEHLDTGAAQLAAVNPAPAAAAVFSSMRRYAGEATWGVKIALTHAPELQLYVKKALPVTEVNFWLLRRGADEAARAGIEAVSAILEKPYTHFLGADFSPNRPAAFQVYFTQYTDAEGMVAGRLRQALAHMGLPAATQDAFNTYHPLLSGPSQTVWLSLSVVDGVLLPTVKLDYGGVRLGVAAMVLEDAGGATAAPALARLQLLRDTLGIPRASYFGVRYGAGTDLRASVYLTRLSRSGY